MGTATTAYLVGRGNNLKEDITNLTVEVAFKNLVYASSMAGMVYFMIEAVILSVAEDIISTGFDIDGAMIVGVLTFFKHSVPLVAIALAVGVSGGIGVIFGVVPARRAA